jgi:hypothetical protein
VIITWVKRLVLTLSFLTLIAVNVLTLTSTAFNAALSGLMSATFGVQTVSDALRGRLDAKNKTIKKHTAAHAKRKAATRRFGTRLASRTKRVAAASVAAIPGEAIPFLGISLLIAGTTYELLAACDNMRDLDELYSDMGMANETPDDVLHSVCDPSLPDAEKLWIGTIETGERWWGKFNEHENLHLSVPETFSVFP